MVGHFSLTLHEKKKDFRLMTDQEPTADHTSSVGCSNTAIYIIPDWLGAPQQRQASRTIICYKKRTWKRFVFSRQPLPNI